MFSYFRICTVFESFIKNVSFEFSAQNCPIDMNVARFTRKVVE